MTIPWVIYYIPFLLISIFSKINSLIFILLFLFSELIFTNIEIGNYFLQLGNLFAVCPAFIQWYKFTGAFGGTIAILLLVYLVYLIIFRKRNYCLILLFSTIVFVLFFPFGESNNIIDKKGKSVIVGTVINDDVEEVLLSNSNLKLDYIITPEAAITLREHSFHLSRQIMSLKRSLKDSISNCTLFLGGWIVDQNNKKYNTAICLSRNNPLVVRGKQLFIPFGEVVPYRDKFQKAEFINKLIPDTVSLYNSNVELIKTNKHTISPLICYESMFANFMADQCIAGVEVFFILARNPFSDNKKTEKLIKNIIIVNSIITNKYIARASTYGFSYILTNKGKEVKLRNGKNNILYGPIILNNDNTFYVKYYKSITWIYFIVVISLIILLTSKSKDNKILF